MPDASLTVDFSVRSGVPLIKKFSVYNSGCTSLSHYERDIALLQELDVASLRVDLGMGGSSVMLGHKTVTGSADHLIYDFDDIERVAKLLNEKNVLPYYSWCYLPEPINDNGDNRKLNKNVAHWQEIWSDILETSARHFRANNVQIGYHEVYNEPDLSNMFLLENWNVYLDLYRYGSQALLKGDPDAVIGGPAVAFAQNRSQIKQFLAMIDAEDLPLDFFSFHAYTSDSPIAGKLQVIYEALEQYPKLKKTELHLNELNVFSDAYTQDSVCNFHAICPSMLDLFDDLLNITDITMVNWTQFMDIDFNTHAFGLVNRDGRVKASYNALKCYSDMPEERVSVTTSSRRILRAFASADSNKAAVLAWNRQYDNQRIRIELNNIPFDTCQLRLYRIDEKNADAMSGGTQHLEVQESVVIKSNQSVWEGTIPGRSVIYLILSPSNAKDFTSYLDNYTIGHHVRNHYWFEKRQTDAYSWFDSRENTFYLGTGSQTDVRLLCGTTLDQTPDWLCMHISGLTDSELNTGSFSIRIDYASDYGYSKALLLHAGEPSDYSFPFGTMKPADIKQIVHDLSVIEIPVAKFAPNDWTGRTTITVEAYQLMPNIHVTMKLRKE